MCYGATESVRPVRRRCPNSGRQRINSLLKALDVRWTGLLNRPMEIPNSIDASTIQRLIVETLPAACRDNPRIFGAGGPLDSLGLVNFLADLEYRLADVFGREVVLASERAMSRSRSPFRDVASLTDYIQELLGE
jgi:hypothetical protein